MTRGAQATSGFRVSNREAKEETYRALRAKGYDWGRSQAAGRITDVLQVVWGAGLGLLLPVLRRAWWQPRSSKVTGSGEALTCHSRGLGVALAGPTAVGLALAKPQNPLSVTGMPCTPHLAAAVWDLSLEPSDPVWWGVEHSGQLHGYCIDQSGNLHQIGEGSNEAGFRIGVGVVDDTAVILSAEQLRGKLTEALRGGVAVDPGQWNQLMSTARKFLVPGK